MGCTLDKSNAFFHIEPAAEEKLGNLVFIEPRGIILQVNGLIGGIKIHFADTIDLAQGTERTNTVFRRRSCVSEAEVH